MSTTTTFFEQQKEKSKIKTLIVTDFFKVYFPIINNSVGQNAEEIIYIDLFSGPGEFENGEPSTPIALLDLINNSKSDDIRNKLRIIFNDENKDYVAKLNTLISRHEVTPSLKFEPLITSLRACDVDIKQYTRKKVPIFSFIDPWGYVDLSAEQTWALVKNIGSDCVLFFNSNRFLMDIPKEAQTRYFEPIFGEQLPNVIQVVNELTMGQKAKAQKIVELFSKNLCNEMTKCGFTGYKLYVLPFGFEADDKDKISHYIIFITKNHKAIIEMKKVMIKHSNTNTAEFCFDSKDQLQISLFNRENCIEDSIIDLIKQCCQDVTGFIDNIWTVASLLKALDDYHMSSFYQVTPYSLGEVKVVLEVLDKKGFIQLVIEPDKKIMKHITDGRKFKLRKELLI